MRIGAFELKEPLPDLKNAQALAMLTPWIDVGDAGTSTLRFLETCFNASELGKLARPGMFYDFTRYRPMASFVEERRVVTLPNTFLRYCQRPEGTDFLFIHSLEPHNLGEAYVESVLKVLVELKVKRYCLVGGMYDSMPHTRPLLVTGSATDGNFAAKLKEDTVRASRYQGPTTINNLIAEGAQHLGIETMTLIVHLPQYMQLEEDFNGQYRLLRLLSNLYGLSVDLDQTKRMGEEQYLRISQAVEADPEVKGLVEAMEKSYDEGLEEGRRDSMPKLSPEVEKFLREIEKRLDSN